MIPGMMPIATAPKVPEALKWRMVALFLAGKLAQSLGCDNAPALFEAAEKHVDQETENL